MNNRMEQGPSYQTGADAVTLPEDHEGDDSDGRSGTFGISGMDGFALTSQPRRVPAMRSGPGELQTSIQ